jgi:hypothetical protein
MAVTILLANGEGDHNFSGGTDGPSRDGAFHDHRRRGTTTTDDETQKQTTTT